MAGDKECCSTYRFPGIAYVFIAYQFISAIGAFVVTLIIPIYMTSILKLSPSTSTSLYHAKNALSYVFNIFGALIADGLLGRARSYLIFMPIDLVIMGCLAVMSVYVVTPGMLAGIFLLAVLGGLTTPAIRALIPDQIPRDRVDMLSTYMHLIYLANNIGALISAYIAPILHKDIYCFNMECYPLNFSIYLVAGITSFMIVLLSIKCGGAVVHEATDNLLANTGHAISHAIRQRIRCGKPTKGSDWLDYSNEIFGREFVQDIRVARNLCVFLVAHPLFWLVFDQLSSIWTLQARFMDGRVSKNFDVKADQIQTLNPLLVILLIPLFEATVYPLMNRANFKVPYRIVLGIFFTATAALSMLFIQLKIDNSLDLGVAQDSARVKLYSLNNLTSYHINNFSSIVPSQSLMSIELKHGDNFSVYCDSKLRHTIEYDPTLNTKIIPMVIGMSEPCQIHSWSLSEPQNKGGYASVVGLNFADTSTNYTIDLEGVVGINKNFHINTDSEGIEPVKCGIGEYKIYLREAGMTTKTYKGRVELHPAHTVTLIVSKDATDGSVQVHNVILAQFELISIFWQVIPYVLVTIGEILFNVNNNVFLYGEAPASMKAMMLSMNYLCIGIGNILILAMSQATRNVSGIYMFLLCSILTTISGIITTFLAYRYLRMKRVVKRIPEIDNSTDVTEF